MKNKEYWIRHWTTKISSPSRSSYDPKFDNPDYKEGYEVGYRNGVNEQTERNESDIREAIEILEGVL